MKIHEYQAKEIFRRFGVPTPRGEMVTTPEQARAVAERVGTKIVVVKAQIHAGGRGKAGGVKLAKSPAEAADLAKSILGMKLVTPQTGPGGRIVQRLLVEEGLDIKRELYLSILVDRASAAPVIMASTAGANGKQGNADKKTAVNFCGWNLSCSGVGAHPTCLPEVVAWGFSGP